MYGSILVGTDGSETAGEALLQAIGLAVATGARLQVVSAYEPESGSVLRPETQLARWELPARADVDDTLARAREQAQAAGVACEVHARRGDPADAILDLAEEQRSDLIVVGHKGMTGAERFLLGSVSSKVSSHAPCSVLVVRTS